jgi:hypothetical protein
MVDMHINVTFLKLSSRVSSFRLPYNLKGILNAWIFQDKGSRKHKNANCVLGGGGERSGFVFFLNIVEPI